MSSELKTPEIIAPDIIPGSALEALNRSEIEQQITTARRFPRSITAFRNRGIQMATFDEDTAASCEYQLKRGDKPIVGPSVRFAEIVAAAYGNLRAGARIIDVGEKEVTAQGMAHDLENNTAYQVEVRRRITTKDGRRFSDDMILVTCNAACAIALRNAVFKVVPMALAKPILEAAQRTAIGDEKTFKGRCAAAFKQFAEFGVSEEMLLRKLDRKGSADLTVEDLRALHGLLTAIRENEVSVEDEFGSTTRPNVPPRMGREPEKPKDGEGGAPDIDAVLRAIQAAKTGDDLDSALSLCNALSDKDKASAKKLIEDRRAQLGSKP